ncbi:ATP-binding cassette domain-containing protein [Labilibaculum sp. A4]|uniref:ABC transporter ATP-binding protein n=1 Tax=Labilibaculum manganireducens TaxID=1940525 RepID=A0A2N3IDH6_9BACT|nr:MULTISPECIES: ABC transporter ATP-binding protein [Labilibaculum]MBN2596371.1 ABC transporter ATP-binding protein [Marinifilaceae bacterium]MDQ1770192.1 ABC transporter ATP-binding protein [Labilibaculum euxinus]MWN77594.1 ATP-binding cassette domain-containing protein [Labilibaculum euxinus]PKQ68366.1 ABC transporter ATP-binding protein [Labilibaculum manganireducens]
MQQAIVECKNLTHYYGKRCIYENLNFEIPKGRILGLLGKNGTGKTTTINILNGYLQPRSGECLMFGESSANLSPETKQKVGLLIEGHVQYSFMNISEIEKFYSAFYPKWRKDAYYELMKLLKIDPKQKISRMSCGQRSQVALGLILAQDPELLILDDFSMGLDPGYRMLFVDYLSEYAKAENKTVFVTSHIIQDMERLIDDCLIMDYGRIVMQKPVSELLESFKRYRFTCEKPELLDNSNHIYNSVSIKGKTELYSLLSKNELEKLLSGNVKVTNSIQEESLSLEEAFIGLTGKY